MSIAAPKFINETYQNIYGKISLKKICKEYWQAAIIYV